MHCLKDCTRFSRLLLIQNWSQKVQFHCYLPHDRARFWADTKYHRPQKCYLLELPTGKGCHLSNYISIMYTSYQHCFICLFLLLKHMLWCKSKGKHIFAGINFILAISNSHCCKRISKAGKSLYQVRCIHTGWVCFFNYTSIIRDTGM